MKKKVRVVFSVAVGVVVLGQFIRPARENPLTDPGMSIRASQTIPAKILATLERSCFDCHSNETRWPWYSAVTPMNFLIADDVTRARKRLNFSEWGKHKPLKLQGLLQMIDDQVSLKEMPLPRYLYHPGAALADSEIKAISEWALTNRIVSLSPPIRKNRIPKSCTILLLLVTSQVSLLADSYGICVRMS